MNWLAALYLVGRCWPDLAPSCILGILLTMLATWALWLNFWRRR